VLDLVAAERERHTMRVRREYAERIKRARTSTGMSLRAFAEHVGSTAARLSDYENRRRPTCSAGSS
jgi:ribosome-binding protein aMBF1 (putative translation factor)